MYAVIGFILWFWTTVRTTSPASLGRPPDKRGDDGFVDRWVTLTLAAGAPYSRRRVEWAIRGLVASCRAIGAILDESILDLSSIERHVAANKWLSPAVRANQRSILHWVRLAILGPPAIVRGRTLSAATPSAPFTADEVAQLCNFAEKHPRESVRQNLSGLLGLCLGVGLATEDLRRIRGTDIRRRDNGSVCVTVTGRRARTVTCTAEWEDTLAAAGLAAGDAYVFRPGREDSSAAVNVVSNYVADLDWPPELQGTFTAKRARATWIVRHLEAGIPARVLIQAAGVAGLDALDRYVRYTAPTPRPAADTALRGES